VVEGVSLVIFAVPSHGVRDVAEQVHSLVAPHTLLVSAAKGIEENTHLTISQILKEVTKRPEFAVLSGPTFAKELLEGVPSAVVAAAAKDEWAVKVQRAFNGDDFRVYTSHDVRGVELGGALKNVIAIAAGACAGLGLGENTAAALMTRGLSELSRIGVALGGEVQTFFGLSGVGDLILTCSSSLSRNYQVGFGLGQGKKLAMVLASLQGTAEGIRTARSVHQILKKCKLEAPILEEIYGVLYEGKPPKDALMALMTREPKREFFIPPQGPSKNS
jgi:glycerol-3-phosphate dehydrogenase (NAD(P)+)